MFGRCGVERWLWRAGALLIGFRVLALVFHFLGPSPYGGSLTSEPERLVFHAIFLEAGFLGLLVLSFGFLSRLVHLSGRLQRVIFLLLASSYLCFAQFDLEVVRWLGEHISLTFLRNYFHKTEGSLLTNLLWSDWLFTGIGLLLAIFPFGLSVWLFFRKWEGRLCARTTALVLSICAIFVVGAWSINPSEKRMRRVTPVAWSLGVEIVRDQLGLDKPENPMQTRSDLLNYLRNGQMSQQVDSSIFQSEYPLLQKSGPGNISAQEWRKLPLSDRPNIVLVVVESWRVWSTSLVNEPGVVGASPALDSVIKNESFYFPFMQSEGYPSVEGSVGIHLGVWPHPRNIFASSYVNIGSQSWPEILRDFGYRSEIYLGFDPAFSNMLPWYRRWYDRTVFEPSCEHDGPLLDSLIGRYRLLAQDSSPFLLTTWTNTTHPPYRVPATSGVKPAEDEDVRFDQAMHYAGQHLVAFLDRLKAMPEWSRTVVILVGDHAQPMQEVRKNPAIAGTLTPGHTWVPLAILGGWSGIPKPQRNEQVIPQMDLAPTILEMLNISAPNHFMGMSLLHPQAREFPCFRFGEVNLVRDSVRLDYRLGNHEMVTYSIDKHSNKNFGLLPGHTCDLQAKHRFSLDLPRYTDMFYSYGLVLDEDRLFPHRANTVGTYEQRK